MNLRRYTNRFFLLLSVEPPVIYVKDWLFDKNQTAFRMILELLRRRQTYILVQLSWSNENPSQTDRMKERVNRYIKRFKNHRVIILCNTEEEHRLFTDRGVETVYCNGSAFLDASVFYPIPECDKEYHAIYDAKVLPFKRHDLAQNVKNLALITYRDPYSTRLYTKSVRKILHQATWLNGYPDSQTRWLCDHEVNRHINRARVGLSLSAVEGAMYASSQYLLAGMPIVTTESTGGRSVFYDPAYVRIVDDDPSAVSAAVETFCATPPDPNKIRESTLFRFDQHRRRFLDLMDTICGTNSDDEIWRSDWPRQLPNKLHGADLSLGKNVAALLRHGQPPPWRAK